MIFFFFFFQAEDGIRDWSVTGVQTCALPIYSSDWNMSDILHTDEGADPEELVLRREDSKLLHEILHRLLSDFEWRVLAGYQLGKSYREIACELRCKTKSVDNALARIKRKVSSVPVDRMGWDDF